MCLLPVHRLPLNCNLIKTFSFLIKFPSKFRERIFALRVYVIRVWNMNLRVISLVLIISFPFQLFIFILKVVLLTSCNASTLICGVYVPVIKTKHKFCLYTDPYNTIIKFIYDINNIMARCNEG